MNSQPSRQFVSQFGHSLLTKNKSDLISILTNEEYHLPKRINCVEILVDKFIPNMDFDNLEQEVFSILMPTVKDIIDMIFKKNLEIINTHNSNLVPQAQEYIQMCLKLFEAISSILSLILSKGVCVFSAIGSVPLNVVQMIYSCFLHCHVNNNSYQLVNSLREILLIFKKAQEVHAKFLKILEIIEIDPLENEKEYILSVAGSLCQIGEILSGMNVKSMTETWKSYIVFTKKYSYILSDDINVARPLKFISSEVMKCLETISNYTEEKIFIQTLKISSFLLKVAIKMFETFWEVCRASQEATIDFFCKLYSYTNPFTKNFNKTQQEAMNNYIYQPLDCVLLKLFDLSWTEKVDDLDLSTYDTHIGFVIMTANVLPNLDIENNFGIVSYYLKLVLKLFGEEETLLSTDLQIGQDSVYVHLVTSFASKILSVNGEEYYLVEEILLETVLCGSFWQSLLASDIWIVTLRHAPPTIAYDTIINILEKIRTRNVEPSFGYKILINVIRNLNSNLPNSLKVKVLDKYPPETHPDVWSLIGFGNLPAAKSFLKNVSVDNLCKRLDNSDMITWDKKDVMTVTWMMEILSCIELSTENINKNRLGVCLVKLWEFDAGSQSELLNNQMFTNYATSLGMITLKALSNFTNQQLLQVLKQMRTICRLTPNIAIQSSKMLIALSNKSPSDENMNGRVSLLLKTLICEHNPFLKLHVALSHNSLKTNWGTALDLNKDFEAEEFVQSKKIKLDDFEETCSENKQIEKNICEPSVGYKKQSRTTLSTSYLTSKKDADEDIDDILDEMKSGVKTLMKYSAQGKIKKEDSREIFSIISKLNKLV